MKLFRHLLIAGLSISALCTATAGDGKVFKPVLVGDWWQVASNPDLGPLTSKDQQPVDFGIWQAADGTWQIWSCIRNTKEKGKTRLFHRWEGKKLTDKNWTPMGVAMQGEPKLGESLGGMQAPFVFRPNGKFLMHYGSWEYICSAESIDGKTFTRITNSAGTTRIFERQGDDRARDAFTVRIGDKWHCYYVAHPKKLGGIYCRTSTDLKKWSAPVVVARGGRSGTGPYSAECPVVIELSPGNFYLFRTQKYGTAAQTMVYYSKDPLNFGVDNDKAHYVCTLPVAAPEIFKYEGQWYMATLLPTLNGIKIGRLTWEETKAPGEK